MVQLCQQREHETQVGPRRRQTRGDPFVEARDFEAALRHPFLVRVRHTPRGVRFAAQRIGAIHGHADARRIRKGVDRVVVVSRVEVAEPETAMLGETKIESFKRGMIFP